MTPDPAVGLLETPPLALYVHIPWCVRKCPYCDFNSHVAQDALPEQRYVMALLADLDAELADPAARHRALTSIFIGGGTPSLFSAAAIARLIEGIQARFACAGDIEITLEANPGTLERGRFAEYRSAGVNRLSIGVQSFDDTLLARIGRIHDGAAALRAAEAAHAAGFARINLDLMYALPGQTPAQATADIATACALAPTHISHYSLTLEPGTHFGRHTPAALPDEEAEWIMSQHCREQLMQAGFTRYEVSAYAQAGDECHHNLNYWEYGDYLGIGAGAHGKLTDRAHGTIHRRARRPAPEGYLETAGSPAALASDMRVAHGERSFEFMLNALRLERGFTLDLFEARTGLARDDILPQLHGLAARGLLHIEGMHCRTTRQGALHLNTVITEFLSWQANPPC
jgi:oxygen-independent coproporphyrinogen-3 oxidase